MIKTAGDIVYHRLRSGGYQLKQGWWCRTGIVNYAAQILPFLTLRTDGLFLFRAGWPWDGPSGPMRDTPDAMMPSLVHDGFYMLFRGGRLPQSMRKAADRIFYELLRQNGVSWFRASYAYLGVRLGAGYAAKVSEEPEHQTMRAPG